MSRAGEQQQHKAAASEQEQAVERARHGAMLQLQNKLSIQVCHPASPHARWTPGPS
jgi:hypothetical protein